MKNYAAFLRAVNISGKNKIEMAKLKAELESEGFYNVSTYLNSGNVTFTTDKTDSEKVIKELITKKFGLTISVFVIEKQELSQILEHAPQWWDSKDKDKYDNLIFILSDHTPQDICQMIGETSQELEKIQIYKNVIFWTFDKKQYQKCLWWKKTASKTVSDKLTIRTANTVKKICK